MELQFEICEKFPMPLKKRTEFVFYFTPKNLNLKFNYILANIKSRSYSTCFFVLEKGGKQNEKN